MQKRWLLKPKNDVQVTKKLCEALGINEVMAELLVSRGINTFDEARLFFRPSLDNLHDPFLMKDMDRAIARITQALHSKEKILIYGDYDVDGTTAVAVVYSFFRSFYNNLDFYIPDRYSEGYGISTEGIDYASEHGYTLIIALDCGIKSIEKVRYASSKGIDFIIGDHHLPDTTLPQAVAVLDPKRHDCPYPFKELSGCGIGFKIVQAFIQRNDMEMQIAFDLLDLVAVSIASDIVPVTGENRILLHYGLKKLNEQPCFGLQALINLIGSKKERLSASDIVFQIGPRINAAGRIHHAKDAVKLLTASSFLEASEWSRKVDEQNIARKDVDLKITEEALALIDNDERLQRRNTTVLYKATWHKGVIGIVASRLIERYYRPTIILTETNGQVAGSARSILGFDLYKALAACADLLDQFGGHKYAAGLTMQTKNIELFQQRFEEVVSEYITPDMLQQEVSIDSEIRLNDIDAKFYRLLKQFEPFGPLNENPVFMSSQVHVVDEARIVGSNHLKLKLAQDGSAPFEAIGFGMSEHITYINTRLPFDICYSIEENTWRGHKNLQLNLKAIRY